MKNLTNDQIQLMLMLFLAQNADRDIEDFIPDFQSFKYGFSNCRKIGDLNLRGTALVAVDDDTDKFEWRVLSWFKDFYIWKLSNDTVNQIHFDIVKYISFEDKI